MKTLTMTKTEIQTETASLAPVLTDAIATMQETGFLPETPSDFGITPSDFATTPSDTRDAFLAQYRKVLTETAIATLEIAQEVAVGLAL